MFRVSLVFFVLSLMALVFGEFGIAGMTIEMGRNVFYLFLSVSLVVGAIGLLSPRGSRIPH